MPDRSSDAPAPARALGRRRTQPATQVPTLQSVDRDAARGATSSSADGDPRRRRSHRSHAKLLDSSSAESSSSPPLSGTRTSSRRRVHPARCACSYPRPRRSRPTPPPPPPEFNSRSLPRGTHPGAASPQWAPGHARAAGLDFDGDGDGSIRGFAVRGCAIRYSSPSSPAVHHPARRRRCRVLTTRVLGPKASSSSDGVNPPGLDSSSVVRWLGSILARVAPRIPPGPSTAIRRRGHAARWLSLAELASRFRRVAAPAGRVQPGSRRWRRTLRKVESLLGILGVHRALLGVHRALLGTQTLHPGADRDSDPVIPTRVGIGSRTPRPVTRRIGRRARSDDGCVDSRGGGGERRRSPPRWSETGEEGRAEVADADELLRRAPTPRAETLRPGARALRRPTRRPTFAHGRRGVPRSLPWEPKRRSQFRLLEPSASAVR